MHYNPSNRVDGVVYYQVGQILNILLNECDREDVKALCDRALTYKPSGLELRNEFLLPIRAGLQEWKSGITISIMCKLMITRLLDDTVQGGVFDYERLYLSTVIGFDPSKEMKKVIVNG